MTNTSLRRVPCHPSHQPQLPSEASSISVLKARQCAKIAELREALIASGFDSVDAQAAVLGLSRSSTWMILNRNHKASGLSASVINRILRSTQLPTMARHKLEEYVEEKLAGKYGHPRQRLRRFRNQLLSFTDAATSLPEKRGPSANCGKAPIS